MEKDSSDIHMADMLGQTKPMGGAHVLVTEHDSLTHIQVFSRGQIHVKMSSFNPGLSPLWADKKTLRLLKERTV